MFLRENEIVRRLAEHLRPGQSVLDVGSGTGLIARRLAATAGVKPTLCDVVDYNKVDLPYVKLADPLRIPAGDASYDAVIMLFVLHHIPSWEDQLVVAAEAMRIARERVLVIEDTPFHAVDRIANTAWDWLLNVRHGVPTPFTFRSVEAWSEIFSRDGYKVASTESYRPKWPTLGMYHHTLFVLDRVE
jgi:ubiquinone/menaquinone biosynthesis C-methylase UbiE